jgi:predicted nucleic acid-binding Zn ribbon protein
MTFQALQGLLKRLEQQYQTPEQQEWRRLEAAWPSLVKSAADQTRPVTIRRGVLQVAVAHPAWVQTLMFQRVALLAQVNALLDTPLTDIRFSTTGWHQADAGDQSPYQMISRYDHPSAVPPLPVSPQTPPVPPPVPPKPISKTPQAAFQNWADRVQARAQILPLCPQCGCPTPPGELERWQICGICLYQPLDDF